MKTPELLMLVFVFLVGYMLFKRCGCIEGIVTDTCSDYTEKSLRERAEVSISGLREMYGF